jgi:hypothetical protein
MYPPPERLMLHRVCKDNMRNTNRSTDLTLHPNKTLFGKDVHMSHVLLQSITNSAHCCTQSITIFTQYTDTPTIG